MDPFTIAAIALTLVGTGVGVYGAMEQGAAAKQSERTQQRLQDRRAARERTQQIRQARIQRAQVFAKGANQGAGESSGVQGGAYAASSNAYSNIQYINAQQGYGQAMSRARQRGMDGQGISALGAGLQDLGSTVFTYKDELGDIFGTGSSTKQA
jgi:hypothetical protein